MQVSACRRNKRQHSRRQAAATLQAQTEPASAGAQAVAEAADSTTHSSAQAGATQASPAPILRGHEGAIAQRWSMQLAGQNCFPSLLLWWRSLVM